MDDELEQLEAELQRLRPISPSPALRRALADRLSSRPRRTARRIAWLALPIAAAIAVLFTLWPDQRKTSSAPRPAGAPGTAVVAEPIFKPVAAENLLLASAEDGNVTLADGTPARRVRRAYLDTITWKNPHTNASLTWTIPREEVRVTPVNFQ